MDSGYPTNDVVNTVSPLILVFAPKLLPSKMGPPRIVKVAGSYEGLFERGETHGAGEHVAPSTTVALERVCTASVKLLLLVA